MASLAGLVILSLIAGTAISSYFASRAIAEARNARAEKRLSDRRWYGAEFSLASRAWQDGTLTVARKAADDLALGRTISEDFRGFESHYLDRLFQLDLQTLRQHQGPVWQVACHPGGRWIASAGHDGTVVIWDLTSAERPRILRGHTRAVECVAWSADGERLVSGSSDRTVRIWTFATGAEALRLGPVEATVTSVDFRPDGKRIAAASIDGMVTVWDCRAGELVRTMKGSRISLAGNSARTHGRSMLKVIAAFSPDGESLAWRGPTRRSLSWMRRRGKSQGSCSATRHPFII